MALDATYLAFSRFGLGPRPGDASRLGQDPKAALLAEIADPTSLFLSDAGLPSTVDAYAQVRQIQLARRMFERLLAFRNDVGLLAEEYDPKTGRFAGNFPLHSLPRPSASSAGNSPLVRVDPPPTGISTESAKADFMQLLPWFQPPGIRLSYDRRSALNAAAAPRAAALP